MNFINSFNVQGEPCVMGYNKLVVPYTEINGIKAPVIYGIILEFINGGDEAVAFTKEEFLQFFGGALPETSGSYLLVENIEDTVGITSKWTENVLAEKMLEFMGGAQSKVYTVSGEDLALISLMYPSLSGDDIATLVTLSTIGFTIIDAGEQVLLTIGLPLSF